jgi:hypothetical protein
MLTLKEFLAGIEEQKYPSLVSAIEKGELGVEPIARKIAKENGFSISELDQALHYGCIKKIGQYIEFISSGITDYYPEVEEIMNKYGHILSMNQKQSVYLRLDGALEIGREREYDRIVGYVEQGCLRSEPLAREIAEKNGYSTERLDKALFKGEARGYSPVLPAEKVMTATINPEEEPKIDLSLLESIIERKSIPVEHQK